MITMKDILARLNGPLGGPGTPPIMPQPAPQESGAAPGPAKPMTLEELLKSRMQTLIPIGTDYAQSYAPHGSQLNFTGGSPFPVDDTPAAIHNGSILLSRIAEVIGDIRKRQAEAKATQKAQKPAKA